MQDRVKGLLSSTGKGAAPVKPGANDEAVKAHNAELMREAQAALKAGDRAGRDAQKALEQTVDNVNKEIRSVPSVSTATVSSPAKPAPNT